MPKVMGLVTSAIFKLFLLGVLGGQAACARLTPPTVAEFTQPRDFVSVKIAGIPVTADAYDLFHDWPSRFEAAKKDGQIASYAQGTGYLVVDGFRDGAFTRLEVIRGGAYWAVRARLRTPPSGTIDEQARALGIRPAGFLGILLRVPEVAAELSAPAVEAVYGGGLTLDSRRLGYSVEGGKIQHLVLMQQHSLLEWKHDKFSYSTTAFIERDLLVDVLEQKAGRELQVAPAEKWAKEQGFGGVEPVAEMLTAMRAKTDPIKRSERSKAAAAKGIAIADRELEGVPAHLVAKWRSGKIAAMEEVASETWSHAGDDYSRDIPEKLEQILRDRYEAEGWTAFEKGHYAKAAALFFARRAHFRGKVETSGQWRGNQFVDAPDNAKQAKNWADTAFLVGFALQQIGARVGAVIPVAAPPLGVSRAWLGEEKDLRAEAFRYLTYGFARPPLPNAIATISLGPSSHTVTSLKPEEETHYVTKKIERQEIVPRQVSGARLAQIDQRLVEIGRLLAFHGARAKTGPGDQAAKGSVANPNYSATSSRSNPVAYEQGGGLSGSAAWRVQDAENEIYKLTRERTELEQELVRLGTPTTRTVTDTKVESYTTVTYRARLEGKRTVTVTDASGKAKSAEKHFDKIWVSAKPQSREELNVELAAIMDDVGNEVRALLIPVIAPHLEKMIQKVSDPLEAALLRALFLSDSGIDQETWKRLRGG